MITLYRLPFLFFMSLGLALPLKAQKAHVVELHKQTLALPDRGFYVQKVVDARPDTTTLGQVHIGVLNRPVEVVLAGQAAPYLHEYLTRQLPARPTDRPVVLRITAMRVAETITYNSEVGKAQCTFEWYELLPTGHYRRLGGAMGSASRGGLDVTSFHASNLVAAMQKSLEQLSLPGTANPEAPLVTWAQLTSTATLAPSGTVYPVLEAEVINKGRYRTFHDFRDNTPDHTLPFEVETTANTEGSLAGTYRVRPYITDATGKQRPLPADTWGFSDGNHVFIRYQNTYFPLERRGNLLSFRVYSVQPGPLFIGAGGLLGAAVGIALSAAMTHAYEHEFTVDITNGNVFNATNLTQVSGPVADSAKVVLYRFEGAKVGLPALVLLNGVPQDSLKANAQLALRLHHQSGPWRLSLRTVTGEASLDLRPSFRQPNFVECAAATGTVPNLQAVPGKEGEFALRRIGTWQQAATKRAVRTAAK
ncbi:hypothetical protein [Hymenobacter crusticola]|uniref:Uncharacterized protein n=1 Tax=Hymenobacter crusticola TaxID=1770526 RepID=A0A243WGI2_9BACT|nr:hypothetical protein [Hymenobacter crusticola]OUJ74853.1 hypothetical protein BXP70_08870 [Hymenobacter crusticola]